MTKKSQHFKASVATTGTSSASGSEDFDDTEEELLRDERGHIFFQTQVCGILLTTHLLSLQVLTWESDDPEAPPIRGPILVAIPAESIIGLSYKALSSVPNSFEVHVHLCPTSGEVSRARQRQQKRAGRSTLLSFWGGDISTHGPRWLSGDRHSDTLKFFYMEIAQRDCEIWWRAVQHLIRAQKGPVVIPGGIASKSNHDSGRFSAIPSTARSSVASTALSSDLHLPNNFPHYFNRKYLILLLDNHGDKACWSHDVEPFFKQSSIDCHVLQLHSKVEARVVIADFPSFGQYEVVIILGGDDFVSCILQSVAMRKDGRDLLKALCFAPITRSTAAGLQASIAFASGIAPSSPLNATFIALHGRPHPFDMALVTLDEHTCLASSLSQCWGVAADMAQASASFAPLCLGLFGLFNGSVFQVLRNPIYRAELRMTLVDKIPVEGDGESDDEDSIISQYLGLQDRSYAEAIELNALEAGECEADDWSDFQQGVGFDSRLRHGRPRVRRRRACISGDFAFVWAVQTSHSTKTTLSGPGVRLNDGVFTIFVARPLARSQLVEIMNASAEGKHVFHKALRVFQCVDYDLRMLDAEQIVMVDGLQYPCQRMRAEIVPAATHVLSLPNNHHNPWHQSPAHHH